MTAEVHNLQDLREARAARDEATIVAMIPTLVDEATRPILDAINLSQMRPEERADIAHSLAAEQLLIMNYEAMRKFTTSFLRVVEYFVVEQLERGEQVDLFAILSMIFNEQGFNQIGLDIRFPDVAKRLPEIRRQMLVEHRRLLSLP